MSLVVKPMSPVNEGKSLIIFYFFYLFFFKENDFCSVFNEQLQASVLCELNNV